MDTTFTIASGQTASNIIHLKGTVPVLVYLPVLTGTSLTFKVGQSSTDMHFLADKNDVVISITNIDGTNKARLLEPNLFVGVQYLQVISNASEAASREIKLLSRTFITRDI